MPTPAEAKPNQLTGLAWENRADAPASGAPRSGHKSTHWTVSCRCSTARVKSTLENLMLLHVVLPSVDLLHPRLQGLGPLGHALVAHESLDPLERRQPNLHHRIHVTPHISELSGSDWSLGRHPGPHLDVVEPGRLLARVRHFAHSDLQNPESSVSLANGLLRRAHVWVCRLTCMAATSGGGRSWSSLICACISVAHGGTCRARRTRIRQE
eukprot:683142-Rhodomonas_salina.24